MSVDYLLHESSLGYAVSDGDCNLRTVRKLTIYYQIFKVAMQHDTVGARLKEVQEKSQDLANFGT
jgi:hypothetical protein